MKLTKYIVILLSLAGCGVKKEEISRPTNLDLLKDKYEQKISTISGWPSRTDCDATLWAGLACYAGVDLDITEAEYEAGVIHRRPKSEGSCFVGGKDLGARSTVSNDMLSGYVLCGLKTKNLDALDRLYKTSKANNWVTGEALPNARDRIIMSANIKKLLVESIASLGGNRYSERGISLAYFTTPIDYARHLTSVGVLIASDTDEKIIREDIVLAMRSNFRRDENDAFTAAVLGRYRGGYSEKATQLLLSEYSSPSYVRGDDAYHLVHWLAAAKVVLNTEYDH